MPTSQTSKRKRKVGRESGQSLVEFALALMFIILPMLMIFVETSVILFKYVSLSNSAREGARAGSIYLCVGDPGKTYNYVDDRRKAFVATTVGGTIGALIAPPPDCSDTPSTTRCKIGYGAPSSPILDPMRSTDTLTVTLVHTHSFVFGALGNELQLRARSSMRIEPSSVISASGTWSCR
jgi:hypothetical protein